MIFEIIDVEKIVHKYLKTQYGNIFLKDYICNMKIEIFKYLEFLLPIHNCVIIPDLGAFILNKENAKIHDGQVCPPRYIISFNSALTHDDGILTSFIMKDKNIAYNSVSYEIKDSVRSIKSELKNGHSVDCGNLGALSIDIENNILFSPNNRYIHPELLGLYPTRIQYLEQINSAISKGRKHVSLKYITGGIAAVSAAIMLFIAPSIHIYNNVLPTTQNASFLSSITSSISNSEKENKIVEFPMVNEIVTKGNVAEDISVQPPRIYYIIVGGEDTRSRAGLLLNKIKQAGFSNADIVQSPDRFRIYIASFYDKTEAESYLDKFREENPEYKTAWLFSKRNR